MKRLLLFSLLALIMIACGSRTENGEEAGKEGQTEALETGDAKVLVYYFHGKQRCPTCIGIQKLASETVAESFADQPEVAFVEVDFSQKANEPLADKYEVAWSSLIIASGEQHTNLTEAAFANALNNPTVLKELIITQTREYLNL